MMIEESTPPQSSEPVEETVPTLESVYEEFNVAPQQDQPPANTVEQQQSVAPQAPVIPDSVLDPDGFAKHQADSQAALTSQLNAITDQFAADKATKHQEAVSADIKSAVDNVKGDIDVDDGLVQAYLENKAYQDPRFQSIWNNRANNPKALNAALKAVSHELKSVLKVKEDPTLAENQRAVKQSQNNSAVNSNTDTDNDWDVDANDFNHKWAKLTSSY